MIKHNNHNILNISSKDRRELKPYLGQIITVSANPTNDYRDGKSFRLLVSCYLKEIHINVDHLWVETKKIAAVPEGPIAIRACIITYKNNGSEKYGIKIVDEWTKSSKEKKDQYTDPFKAQKKYVDPDKRLFQMSRENEDKYSEQKGNKGINLESNISEFYGRKIPSESNIEYNKRHLEYGYVKSNSYLVENFEISYNTDSRQLILDTDINIDSRNNIPLVKDYIDIDTVIAKYLCEKQNGDIFSKYIYKNKKLVKTYNLIFKNQVYRVLSNEAELQTEWLKNKRRKNDAQRIAHEKNEVERKEKRDFEEQQRRKKIELEKREEIARNEHKRIEVEKLKKESIRREKSKNSGILGKIWIRLTN